MNAAVICVGKLREPWQRDGCAEYLKRLSRFGSIEVTELPDQPEPAKPTGALERRIVEAEGREILRRVRPDDYVVALCIDGAPLSSEDLAQRVLDWQRMGKRIAFVIGGSLGLSGEVVQRANFRLSFSKMTFPHGLMRVILLEQLYRAEKIAAGERYHK